MMLIHNRRKVRTLFTPVYPEQTAPGLQRNRSIRVTQHSLRWHDSPAADATAIAQAMRLETCVGPARQVTDLRRRASLYRSSFVLEEWDVCLDDGTILPLAFKDLSWQGMSAHARAIKPGFLYDPRREIAVYRRILGNATPGTARCFAAAAMDGNNSSNWLLLERVLGPKLSEVGELSVWGEAARWAAGMHRRFMPHVAHLRERAPLLEYDVAFYRRWMSRARAFLMRSKPSMPATMARIRWLGARHERAMERVLALPRTLIHGEFYPSNILIEGQSTTPRVCPIDWELAAIGPGLVDLAALISGGWTEQKRDQIVAAYLKAIEPLPAPRPMDLDAARLHVAVQWLGWTGNWSPPREHAHDWFSDALRLAERIS
jgi:hypothetical protein